ncbi:MAG: HAD hydrolase family protein [Candidatus Firestonebacteria bacterium]|nr:HAD hydrolase family protein [Candidatus Firestonebacteria bacterium]
MKKKINKIKLLAMDVDGVLTDGIIALGNGQDEEYKFFNEKDAAGLRMLIRAGIIPVIITGRSSNLVSNWARGIGINDNDIYQKVFIKKEALGKIIENHNISKEEVAYIGDDLIDIGVLKRVGFAVAVENAVSEVKKEADYITKKRGGEGAVREVIDLILKTQKKWIEVTEKYY